MHRASNEWKNKLPTLQYIINNTYHSVVKSSPKLMFGFEHRNHVDYNFACFTK